MEILAFGFLAQDAASVEVQSIWDLLVKGGVMMIPIGICSLIALTVIVERSVSLRRGNILPDRLLPELEQNLRSGNTAAAVARCKADDSPLARVVARVLHYRRESFDVIERQVEQAGQREILKLRKHLRVLSVIAAVTPLLGLLGTIMGMIRAFQTVAGSAEALGRTELLAQGIYEAMITTAAGLSVAIPVLIGYHWITGRIERLVADLDLDVTEFVERQILGRGAPEPDTETAAEPEAVSATPAVAG